MRPALDVVGGVLVRAPTLGRRRRRDWVGWRPVAPRSDTSDRAGVRRTRVERVRRVRHEHDHIEVSPQLDELHQKYACDIYLRAKRDLVITREEIFVAAVIGPTV